MVLVAWDGDEIPIRRDKLLIETLDELRWQLVLREDVPCNVLLAGEDGEVTFFVDMAPLVGLLAGPRMFVVDLVFNSLLK